MNRDEPASDPPGLRLLRGTAWEGDPIAEDLVADVPSGVERFTCPICFGAGGSRLPFEPCDQCWVEAGDSYP